MRFEANEIVNVMQCYLIRHKIHQIRIQFKDLNETVLSDNLVLSYSKLN